MSTTSTLPVLFATGIHSARPAASAVGSGGLYSCTTHSLVYQTDGVSTWSTWATLGGTGLSDPMTTRGDVIVRNASNVTARLGIGGNGTVLHSDGTDISWQSSSGGLAQSYLGYNTVGGSFETLTGLRYYFKSITVSSTSTFQAIDIYLRPSIDNIGGLNIAICNDNSTAPGVLVGGNSSYLDGFYLSNSASMPGAGRWVSIPLGVTLAAGTYWIGFQSNQARFDVAYDGSGADQTFTTSGFFVTGAYPTSWAITTGSRKYSIRASILS